MDRIRYRSRIFITINEDDQALKASRIKTGQEQLARLGHFPFALNGQNGVYVDFTGAPGVGSSHAYFERNPVETNNAVRKFFFKALNGQAAEESLPYRSDRNLYTIGQEQ